LGGTDIFSGNNCGFSENIFALYALQDIIETIGANRPRLHGFHRFLPHLWELFYWPEQISLRRRLSLHLAVLLLAATLFCVLLRHFAAGGTLGPYRHNRNNPDFRFSLPILLN
jgi:hypothetical protein